MATGVPDADGDGGGWILEYEMIVGDEESLER
jgi:hypothetical protein